MSIKGLIFDFDGLMLDTESPRYKAWCEIYQHFNLEFNLSDYVKTLGSSDELFNPLDFLATSINEPIDRKQWRKVQSTRELELLADEPLLPGVLDLLNEGKKLGLKLAVASSSDRPWVINHLDHFELIDFFDAIETADDVNIVKPHPELYLKAISDLKINPYEGIAFEDAPHGVVSAKEAGLFCVAVPSPLSANLDLSQSDLVIPSLAEINLSQLIKRINSRDILIH